MQIKLLKDFVALPCQVQIFTGAVAFTFTQMPLKTLWIHLFFAQLWVLGWVGCVFWCLGGYWQFLRCCTQTELTLDNFLQLSYYSLYFGVCVEGCIVTWFLGGFEKVKEVEKMNFKGWPATHQHIACLRLLKLQHSKESWSGRHVHSSTAATTIFPILKHFRSYIKNWNKENPSLSRSHSHSVQSTDTHFGLWKF